MNIVWNRDSKERNFSELSVGETLIYMGILFMKVKPITDANGIVWNAVNLERNEMAQFYNTHIVIPCSCTITVK